MGFHWIVRPSESWVPGLGNWREQIRLGIFGVAVQMSTEITAYMKANAQWTDRTGVARRGLFSDVDGRGDMVIIGMAYSGDAPYGEDLELKNFSRKGVLSIIHRSAKVTAAMDEYGPELMERIRELGFR